MSKKKMAIKKSFLVVLLALAMLVSSVFASPIDVTNLKIENVNGEYEVLVTLDNANPASGAFEKLSFTIEELGTSKSVGIFEVDSNESVVEKFNLKEVTDNFDMLKKGEAYTLVASTSTSDVEEAFFFGSQRTSDGLPLVFEEVEVDGEELTSGDLLQVVNGETITIKLKFTAQEDFDKARLRAEIGGYEHDDLFVSTEIFSVKEGVQYTKTLTLDIPADIDNQEDYLLKISGVSDLSGLTFEEYELYVDTQRHRIDIEDLFLTPSSAVEPGQNIVAHVDLKNRGQQSQDSVKVTVAIPALNVEESSSVKNIDAGEDVSSDDMLLFVPEDAEAGQYEVEVTASYNDGYTETVEMFSMVVKAAKVFAEEDLLVSFTNNQDLKAGQEEVFEVVIANPNAESKPISIVPVENAWADVEVTPTLAMVKGGEDAVFTVKVTPKAAVEGEKDVVLSVKEGATTISEVTVSTYVEGGEDVEEDINFVNVALAVLLVIAIIILLSLVITIAKRRNDGGEDEISSTEEYY